LDVKQATVGKSDLAQNRELVGRYGRPLAVVELQDNEIRKDFVVTVSVKVQAVTAAVGVQDFATGLFLPATIANFYLVPQFDTVAGLQRRKDLQRRPSASRHAVAWTLRPIPALSPVP
jgi:hypothetical protein